MKTKSTDDFSIGFELECAILGSLGKPELTRKAKKICRGTRISDDGSIRIPNYDYFSVEIVTPPVPITKAMQTLEGMFDLINEYGATNSSCGLHVNISPINKAEWAKMNFLYLAFHPLFKQITDEYGRTRNHFSTPNTLKKTLWSDIVQELDGDGGTGDVYINSGKEAAINLNYIRAREGSRRRIEVRAFGNTNYHKKLAITKGYIYAILEVFRKSKIYNFDYMK